MKRYRVKPSLGRVVVELMPEEERTSQGLYILTPKDQNNHAAKVVAVCDGYASAADDDDLSPSGPNFKVGDMVIFGKWSGIEVTLGRGLSAQKALILNESDILGRIEEVEDGDT